MKVKYEYKNKGKGMNKKLIVTAGIIEHNNKILIGKRKDGKCLEALWEFPGGKLEDNESAKECLKRELKEELNIDTLIGDYIGSTSFKCGEKHIDLLAFKAKYLSGEIQMNCHQELKWVKKSELKDIDFVKADIEIVKILLEKEQSNI